MKIFLLYLVFFLGFLISAVLNDKIPSNHLFIQPVLAETEKVPSASSEMTVEDVLRATNNNIQMLVQEIKKLKAEKASRSHINIANSFLLGQSFDLQHRRDCDPHDGSEEHASCSPNCTSRGSDGSCRSYSEDICY